MKNILENRIFLTVCFLLFILTLFYGMDYFSIWNIESELAIASLNQLSEGILFSFHDNFSPLPQLLISGSLSTVGKNEWALRFPSLILLVFALFSFYKMGSKTFGVRPSLFATLLAIGSVPLLLMGKMGSADIWLFILPLLIFPLTIIQIKKPKNSQVVTLIMLYTCYTFVQPLSAFIFCILLNGLFYLYHKQNKNLTLPTLISIPLIITITLLSDMEWVQGGFLFNYNKNLILFILLSLFGSLSSFGFLPGVIQQLILRIKQKEELSILILIGMIAGLFSFSWLFHFLLLFLIGKQIEAFSQEKYPFKNSVKTLSVIQVVISFFLAAIFLMYGYQWFGGPGFRGALLLGISLWIMGIISLVGMVAINKNQIILGCVLGGIIFNFFLWIQFLPVWENERNYIKDAVVHLKENSDKETDINNICLDESFSKSDRMTFYRKSYFKGVSVAYCSYPTTQKKHYLYLQQDNSEKDSIFHIHKKIKGRDKPWKEFQTYHIKSLK